MLSRTRDQGRRAEIEAELVLPPFPEPLSMLWEAFCRLRARVGSNGWGHAPIGFEAIASFRNLTGRVLSPWDVSVIEALDDVFLAEQRKD